MGLLRFIVRRVLFSVLIIVAEIVFIFVLTSLASSDPALIWAGPDSTSQQVAIIAAQYHLNAPLYVQLYYYLVSFFSGNWGVSPTYQQPVISLIETYFPVTLELAILAFLVKVLLEVALGIVSAMRPNGIVDNAIKVFYTTVRSAPPFLIAIGLLLAFSYWPRFSFGVSLLPSSNSIDPLLNVPIFKAYNPFTGQSSPFWLVDNMPIVNALFVGDWPAFISALQHAVLPVTALVLFGFGGLVRVVKVSMLEVLDQDYIRTARSKGLKERAVILGHALRNSLLPAFTLMGLTFAGLATGSLVVEYIFGYYGLGYYLGQSLFTFDTPSLIAGTVLITIIIVIANLVTDISYGFLDPRTAQA